MTPSQMSRSDSVLWTMERDPRLRSPITAISLLSRRPDIDRLRARIRHATQVVPRLRERVEPPRSRLSTPRWVEVADFNLDRHFHVIGAPSPRDLDAVLAIAREISMARFDPALPLWELTLVEGLKGRRAALIQKLHHSLTDGEGAVEIAGALYDLEPSPAAHAPALDGLDLGTVRVGRNCDNRYARTVKRVESATHRASDAARLLLHPVRSVQLAGQLMGSVARMVAPASSRLSPVLSGRSSTWHMRVLDVELPALLQTAHRTNGTLNDVFVAGVAGALQRYHAAHGAHVRELRMTMPISYRAPGDPATGNRFTPSRLKIPISAADPVERILQVGERCRKARGEPALAFTDTVAGFLDRLPAGVTTQVLGSMLRNVDFVATNVTGTLDPLYLTGAHVLRLYAFAPLAGAALNFTLYSHEHWCCVGVTSDDAAVPDPDVLRSCLDAAFRELTELSAPQEAPT